MPQYSTQDGLDSKPVIPFDSHIARCPIKKLPKKLVVRATGLSVDKSLFIKHTSGVNGRYKLTSMNEVPIEDENDIAFFIIKAINNPNIYEILEPAGLVDDYIAAKIAEKEKLKKKDQEAKRNLAEKLKNIGKTAKSKITKKK